MRVPSLSSLSSLSPKAVRSRLRSRRSLAFLELFIASDKSVSVGRDPQKQGQSAPTPELHRRPSGLSLYGLYPESDASSDGGDDGYEKEDGYASGLSLLEPRPRFCKGLFEVMET